MNHPQISPSPATSYWRLIAAGEPYRLLFPLGCLLGMVGVLLWPAHLWLALPYPLVAHVGLMVQGFLAAFVIGFLATALPRLLDVPKVTLAESLLFAGMLVTLSCMHLLGVHAAANAVFLLLLGLFLLCLGLRLGDRKDIPPPGFVLVLLGFICALSGSGLLLVDALFPQSLAPELFRCAQLFLQQGFVLLPVLGIGAFLLPRFFGLPNRQNFPESLRPPPGWWGKAAFAGCCGLLIVTSFVLEAWGWFRSAFALRALVITVYFCREVPMHRAAYGRGSLAWALRIALLSIPLGYLFMAAFPVWQMAWIHIVFINGFSLLVFTVATRVVYGHSGQDALFTQNLKPVIAFTLLFVLAMATRLSADWMPAVRLSHYAYAAVTWAAAVAVWAIWIMPYVRRPG